MRICFVSTGAFAHVGAYLEHFKAAGHDVRFVALSPSPPRPVPTYDLALGGHYSGTEGKWKYPLSMLRARSLIRRLAPDVVHTHYATSGGLAGLVCGYHPTIVTAHGTDLTVGASSPLWRPLLRAVFRQADCVNAVSEELKKLAVGLGTPAAKVAVLTPGVDLSAFKPREPRPFDPRTGPRLICARRLEPAYDPFVIVAALARLAREGAAFRMTFAGEGPLRRALEERVATLGLCGRVSFIGAVACARMPALLAAHDVYLSPSPRDGTSLSLLEAMAVGLYPVVCGIPANAAWVDAARGGLFHAPGDADDLAGKLRRVMEEPARIAASAAPNRARVAADGDRAANMRRLELLYREIIEKRKKTCAPSI